MTLVEEVSGGLICLKLSIELSHLSRYKMSFAVIPLSR